MDVPVVLASASPRRKVLIARIVPSFTVRTAEVDETALVGEAPEALACRLALAKARAVAAAVPQAVVVGADTVVALRDELSSTGGADASAGGRRPHGKPGDSPTHPLRWRTLGKPTDHDEAAAFLRLLGGRRHVVITAVAVVWPEGRHRADAAHSAVWLRWMTDSEISAYVATGSTMDKAGGYAIQDDGYKPVARIEGSETNVIGLPVALTRRLLAAYAGSDGPSPAGGAGDSAR